MSEGFVHSVKVPRLYKTAANIVKKVVEDAASLKQLIYGQKHPHVKALLALTATTLQHASDLEQIIRNTKLLAKETRLDPYLARVLISELLWGKQQLQSEAKPIVTIKKYENALRQQTKLSNKVPKDLGNKKKVEKPRYVRINTLIMELNEAIQGFVDDGYTQLPRCKSYRSFLEVVKNLGTWEFVQDFHVPELFAFAPGTKFYNHPGYRSGAVLLQDKASCLPPILLNPPPGSVVLDTCAAPGMKTTHLAAMMKNKGKIYAIEKNERRYNILCDFVKSTKSHIVQTIKENASNLDSKDFPDVEYILVDPSCSGSGMDRPEFDKNNADCDPNRLKSLQSFQVFVLRHALLNFPKARRLVYSTCSKYAEENEMVVDEILGNVGKSWKLLSAKKLLNNEWNNFSSDKFNCKDNCLYARADEDMTSGFFVAVFERNFKVPLPKFKKHRVMVPANGQDKEENNEENGDKKNKVENNQDKEENGKENSENVGEPMEKKKKKKKKKKNDEEISVEEENKIREELELIIKGEGIFMEKNEKKQKKAKKNVDEEINLENKENMKKPKKNKQNNLSAETVPSLTASIPAEIYLDKNEKKDKKKKDRKRKTSEKENIETIDLESSQQVIEEIDLGESDEAVSKKKKHKKNKKKKLDEDNEVDKQENGKVEDEEISAPPKKKKKKKSTADDGEEGRNVESENFFNGKQNLMDGKEDLSHANGEHEGNQLKKSKKKSKKKNKSVDEC